MVKRYPPPVGFVVLVNGERIEETITHVDGDLRFIDVVNESGKTARIFGRVELLDTDGNVLRV